MKLKIIVCIGIFLTVLISVTYNAEAYVINGLLDDWGVTPGVYGASDWVPNAGILYVEEDQITDWLGPGGGGQDFDAEALYWTMDSNSVYIALVTGMPPSSIGSEYAGDIFVDFASSNQYGIKTTTVKAGTLYKNPSWTDAWHHVASPARIVGGTGTELGSINFVYAYAYPHTNALYRHYVMEMAVPKSYLGSDWMKAGSLHWSEVCGNDAIDLDFPPIPEPASMLLFSMGALGFGALKRKKR